MPRIALIRDTFAPHRREIIETAPGESVFGYIPDDFPVNKAQIIHNGKAISRDALDSFRFRDVDQITLRVLPKGIGEAITAIGWLAIVIDLVISTIVSVGLSMAIQALMPNKSANRKKYDNTEESPTYSWDGIQNTTRNGEAIPLVYGRHKVAGQYLATYTHQLADDEHTLHALIGVGAGPIGAINGYPEDQTDLTDSDVGDNLKINDNAGTIFGGIETSYRMGAWEQSVIDGFRDSPNEVEHTSEPLTYDSYYQVPTNAKVQGIELVLKFSQGLYYITDRGAFRSYSVNVRVRYREEGTEDWTTVYGDTYLPTGQADYITISPEPTRSEYNKRIRIRDLPPAVYQIEITRVSEDDITVGDRYPGFFYFSEFSLSSIVESTIDDVAHLGVGLVAVKALATEQLSGRLPTITSVVHGKECRVYQPSDEFGADTMQDFTSGSDGKRFWGWSVENIDMASIAEAHSRDYRALYCQHGTTGTRWHRHLGRTAPRFFKKIYGDFDVSVRGRFLTTPVSGDGMAMVIKPQGVFKDSQIGLIYDGAYKWELVNGLANSSVSETGTVTANDNYYRIVKSGDDWTYYTSDDGSTWTERGTADYTLLSTSEYVEVGFAFWSTAGNETTFEFTDFEFADETSYSIESSANPAWVAYDVLTDEHYGIGNHITPTQIDLDTFVSFASYANNLVADGEGGQHRRFRFDGVIDAVRPAWEVVLDLLKNYRATILKQGHKVRVAWQRPQIPADIYSMANIVEGSFKTTESTPKLGANYWEIQYLNEEEDWEQDYAPYPDPAREAGEPYRRKTTPHYGVTRRREAHSAALFACKLNRYATKTIEFEMGIEGITIEPYDVLSIAHDVPQWSVGSGRVIQSTPTSITLDKTVTLAAGQNYQVKIRHKNGNLETQDITTSAGMVDAVNVASWTDRPQPSAIWVVGRENLVTKDFLITSISQANDLNGKLEGVEYNELMYDDTITVLPHIEHSSLPDPRKVPDQIPHSSLVLSERAQVMKDETVQNVVDVTFGGVAGAESYEIWYREQSTTKWSFGGVTKSLHFVLAAVFDNRVTYNIAVVSVGPWGAKRSPNDSPHGNITIIGYNTRPPDVTGLVVYRIGGTLQIKWDAVEGYHIQGYEIRYNDEDDWKTANRLTDIISNTQHTTTELQPGSRYILVKAYNRSGLASENAISIQETIGTPVDEDYLVERIEDDESWDGTATNCTLTAGDMLMDDGYETATYETPEMDLGFSSPARMRVGVFANESIATLFLDNISETIDGTWGQATLIDSSEDTASVHFRVSFRYGDVSGSLGDYTDNPLDRPLVVDGNARYWQVSVEFTRTSSALTAILFNMETLISPLLHTEVGQNVSIGASGSTTINFSSFNAEPTFLAEARGGTAGDYPHVTALSASSASVQYYNASDVQTSGSINWTATGY